jgi:hypothetical protein
VSGAELVRCLHAVSPETKGDLLGGRLAAGGRRDSFVIPVHEGDHLGRPEDLGSDPLDELHSLSETNP